MLPEGLYGQQRKSMRGHVIPHPDGAVLCVSWIRRSGKTALLGLSSLLCVIPTCERIAVRTFGRRNNSPTGSASPFLFLSLSARGNNEQRSKRTIYPVSFDEKTSFIFALSSRKKEILLFAFSVDSDADATQDFLFFPSSTVCLLFFLRDVHFFSLTCDCVTDECCSTPYAPD